MERTSVNTIRELFELIGAQYQKNLEAEDQVLNQIASHVLGRTVELSDARRFSKISHQTDPSKYHILFDHVVIGTISRNSDCVEFTPHKNFQ